MSYTVFARKYRPKTFADVLGQDHVVRTLHNAIAQDRLAQAYLFVGPRGTGKTSTARIFAKALNCTGGPRVDFDPEEDVCREIAEGISMDVEEIDGASNNGVDEVRNLREKVGYAPARGKYRIFYIDEVHMLSVNAFNALLKTLEEPPPHVKFIFATTEAHKILPTILSRCQRFDLRRIPTNIIAEHLLKIAGLENINLDRLAAHAIARAADGGMRDAQSMLDQLVAFCGVHIREEDVMHIFGLTSHETVARLSSAILQSDTSKALSELHEQAESGKDLSKLLADLIFHYRNVLVYQVDPTVAMRELPPESQELLAEQSRMVSKEKLLTLMDRAAEVEGSMRWAPNKRLCFEVGIIKAIQQLGEASLSDVIAVLGNAIGHTPVGTIPNLPIPSSSPPPSHPTPPKREAPEEAIPLPPPVSSPELDETDLSDSSDLAGAPTPVEPTPEPEPPPEPVILLQGAELWAAALQEMEQSLPLSHGWAFQGVYQATEGDNFIIGFHPDDEPAAESIERPTVRREIEAILQKRSGQVLKLVTRITAEVIPPEMELPEPEPPPKSEKQTAEDNSAAAAKDAEAQQAAVEAEFRNDPMIREALDIFDGKIVAGKVGIVKS